MGLIKSLTGAFTGAGTSVLNDQWKEYFMCESIDKDVLVVKGEKKVSSKSSNTNGSDNIISNGSLITVADGQCMLIVEQGKVVEVCAEPGEFKYDSSTEPTVFAGTLGPNILDSLKNVGKRFTFGGDTAKDQRVYYVNLKEILANKYGTATPVPFRVVDQAIGLDIDISVRCNGEYSYKITNPILFYTNVCGNVAHSYVRSEIDSMLKTELLTALQPAFGRISAMGVRYSALPGHTMELSQALNDILSEKWRELRGIEIVSFGINSISAPKEDEDMIKELQKTAVYTNANMAAAMLAQSQGEAMKAAASNEGQGAFMAFAGMNMAQQAGGANAGALFQMGQQNNAMQPQSQANSWQCSCGTLNASKFCNECGSGQPTNGWLCQCGATNTGKFCSECGQSGGMKIVCDKCGYTPDDSNQNLKFCPECGDVIDGNDKK